MEKPQFEPYRGPSRPGDYLYQYVQSQGNWSLSAPRFRIGDAKQDVRNLVKAALRDAYYGGSHCVPSKVRPDMAMREEEAVRGMLAWFDGLSDADAVHFFPRGPISNYTTTRDFAVEAFDKALALHERMAQSRLTRFRIWALFMGREIFGDSPTFRPEEAIWVPNFRKGDSLRDIQTLVSMCAREASEDAYDHVKLEKGNRLHHLATELGRKEGPFDEIARDITGLNKRHKDDIHSTGDLF